MTKKRCFLLSLIIAVILILIALFLIYESPKYESSNLQKSAVESCVNLLSQDKVCSDVYIKESLLLPRKISITTSGLKNELTSENIAEIQCTGFSLKLNKPKSFSKVYNTFYKKTAQIDPQNIKKSNIYAVIGFENPVSFDYYYKNIFKRIENDMIQNKNHLELLSTAFKTSETGNSPVVFLRGLYDKFALTGKINNNVLLLPSDNITEEKETLHTYFHRIKYSNDIKKLFFGDINTDAIYAYMSDNDFPVIGFSVSGSPLILKKLLKSVDNLYIVTYE